MRNSSSLQDPENRRPIEVCETGLLTEVDLQHISKNMASNKDVGDAGQKDSWNHEKKLAILEKRFEKSKTHRDNLSEMSATGTFRQDLHLRKRLKRKGDLIDTLELRIEELESSVPKQGKDGNEDTKTATEQLIIMNNKMEAEIAALNKQVAILQTKDSDQKRYQKRVLQQIHESQLSSKDKEIKRYKFQLSLLEKKIISQKKEIDRRRNEHWESEVKRMDVENRLQRQIDELKSKLLEKDVEIMDEQAKFLEHLASTPSMVVVESRAPRQQDPEMLQCLNDGLQNVRAEHSLLRKQISQVPSFVQFEVKDLAEKIQDAIRATDERNKELAHKYAREIQLRKWYYNQLVELKGNIRVLCRVRPCIKEDEMTDSVVTYDPYDDGVIRLNSKGRNQQYHLDKIFHSDTTQSQVFDEVSSLVRSVIDGFNVCIFAYGQTGSGKTYTMEGPTSDPGVNQRALQLLYEETKNSSWHYDIEASMLEIYNETIRDLLNPDSPTEQLEVKMKQQGGLYVPGLQTVPVKSLLEVNKILEKGRHNRSTATTNMNERSSRSHCLLCVNVTGVNLLTGSKTFGRLNLVDLAGSERVSKSHADGARLKEAQNINRSLSSLGDVISALKNKQAHIPYRNSKLTYLLQECLGGDSKTLMILQISPVEKNVSESICTLSFGHRVQSAELGAATRKIEDENKVTPSSARRPNNDTPKSPMTVTPSNRTPVPKASLVPSKLSLKFK